MLEIFGFTFLILGFSMVYTAKYIVRKFDLIKYFDVPDSLDFNDDDMKKYKLDKAVVSVKVFGFVLALPGILIILLTFK